MTDIDDMILDQEEHEMGGRPIKVVDSTAILNDMLMGQDETEVEDEKSEANATIEQNKILIGKVEKFFSKLNVAAIELIGDVKVGDTIEIEGEGNKLRMKISNIQINKKDVEAATNGDSIGIKVAKPVSSGNDVYVLDK